MDKTLEESDVKAVALYDSTAPQSEPEPKSRSGRKIAFYAPSHKNVNVRVSMVEMPRTVVDQNELARKIMSNSEYRASVSAAQKKSQKALKSLSMLLLKKPSGGSDEGEVPNGPISADQSATSVVTASGSISPNTATDSQSLGSLGSEGHCATGISEEGRSQHGNNAMPSTDIVASPILVEDWDDNSSVHSKAASSIIKSSSRISISSSLTGSSITAQTVAGVQHSPSKASISSFERRMESVISEDAESSSSERSPTESTELRSRVPSISKSETMASFIDTKVRKRTASTPGSSATLRRNNYKYRQRALSENIDITDQLDDPSVPRSTIKIVYPDQQTTVIRIPATTAVEDVVRFICNKKNLDFDTHTLESGVRDRSCRRYSTRAPVAAAICARFRQVGVSKWTASLGTMLNS